jgi:hypothetical protein
MVTLTGLEPATSPAPGENKDAPSPLSYSAIIILTTVCGGARADQVERICLMQWRARFARYLDRNQFQCGDVTLFLGR